VTKSRYEKQKGSVLRHCLDITSGGTEIMYVLWVSKVELLEPSD